MEVNQVKSFPIIDLVEAPLGSDLFGRNYELEEVQKIISEQTQLIAVLGMGGIGKTSLMTEIANQISSQFDYVLWRSLRNPPYLSDLITECIQFFSNQQDSSRSDRISLQINHLMEYMRNYRCLLLLDNFESIMHNGEVGHYREEFRNYRSLLEQVAISQHQSCLILTSREKPNEITELDSHHRSIHVLQLTGLNVSSGREFLERKGLIGTNKDWNTFVDKCSGNPLALRVLAESVDLFFERSISRFLSDNDFDFGEFETMFSSQFDQLTEIEKSIMYWLGIEREAVSPNTLRKNIITGQKVRQALITLHRRSLLEKEGTGKFTLQNVVMEFVTERFVDQMSNEILEGKFSLFQTHAILKSDSKVYIRQNQTRFIIDPIIDRLVIVLGNKEAVFQYLTKEVKELVRGLGHDTGYAGANLVHLILQINQNHLVEQDLSDLVLRKAYFQEAHLHEVDLSNSSLFDSVFSETFGRIVSVATSPNGKFLATGTTNGKVHLWEMESYRRIETLDEHPAWVWSVAFSPDSRFLASASSNSTIVIWDVENNRKTCVLEGHADRLRSIAFCPSKNILASVGADKTIKLWDISQNVCVKTLVGHTDLIWSVDFSSDGKQLATSSNDKTIRIWDTDSGEQLYSFQAHESPVRSVAFVPNTSLLASGSADHLVKIWDLDSQTCLHVLQGHKNRIRAVTASPTEPIVASSSSDQTIRLWNIETGECKQILKGFKFGVRAIDFSPDGQLLVSGSDDPSLRIWDVRRGNCLQHFEGYSCRFKTIDFDKLNRYMISSSHDNCLRLWDTESFEVKHLIPDVGYWLFDVSFSHQGQYFAATVNEGVWLWDTESIKKIKTMQGHDGVVKALSFSKNDDFLASSGDDHHICIWQVSNGRLIKRLEEHNNRVHTLAFHPVENTLLASGGDDATIRTWNIDTGQLLHVFHGHKDRIRKIAFNHDGTLIVSISPDKTIRLWDVVTSKCMKVFELTDAIPMSVIFSSDGRSIFSGSTDGMIRIWDINTGENVNNLIGHSNSARAFAFNEVNGQLASASDDETIKIWDPISGECLYSIQAKKPYEGTNIANTIGLSNLQKESLLQLGAVDNLNGKQGKDDFVNIIKLQQNLVQCFNMEELYNLCFQLNLDPERFPREGKESLIRDMVKYFARHERLLELRDNCQRIRPNTFWD